MNVFARSVIVGLSLAAGCTAATASSAPKHHATKETTFYQTITLQTGVVVNEADDVCTLSATWVSKSRFKLAKSDLYTIYERYPCIVLANASFIEKTDQGWQPTLPVLRDYYSGPEVYAAQFRAIALLPSN